MKSVQTRGLACLPLAGERQGSGRTEAGRVAHRPVAGRRRRLRGGHRDAALRVG